MNDPGLEEPIQTAAAEARDTLTKARHEENSLQHDGTRSGGAIMSRTTPTRWWYASTGFPMIAGTFGPLANAFSICALVENWRVSIPPGGTEEHGIDIRDPRWLIAVNAVSLASALIANLSLLLNMAKRVRFEIAQPITILGFWVASILLIGLISYASTAGFHASGVSDQALTQAYYYGIFAAAIYQIISYLMCVTVWGAYRGKYSKDFELTVAQRTLMLQTISFMVYLLVGALIFSHIENWKFLDAVYWMDFTLLTVGIGDYAPATHLGRSLLFPIAIGGIITLGLVISSIRSLVLDRGSEKMSARMTEKTRARIVKQVASVEAEDRRSRPLMFGLRKKTARDLAQGPKSDHVGELKRRKTEFEAMRTVQDLAEKERKYISLALSTTAFAILWFVGAAVFWKAEKNQKWTYFQALYFSYTSILTIGYGDLYPMSNSGKPFFVVWSLLAVPTLTVLISDLGDTVVKGIKDVTIWLGEISFLPSSETRTRDKLRTGIHRLTLGRINLSKQGKDLHHKDSLREEMDEDWSDLKSTYPGLIKIFDTSERRKVDHRDWQILHRLTDIWEHEEAEDEDDARQRKDHRAEAEHHYRHLLIRHISKIYSDTKLKTPKKYTYAEWAFYLKLFGQDETDGNKHIKPQPHSRQEHGNRRSKHEKQLNREPRSESQYQHASEAQKEGQHVSRWSWIGPKSPLMQDKDEAEWILEHLFQKLEESLHQKA